MNKEILGYTILVIAILGTIAWLSRNKIKEFFQQKKHVKEYHNNKKNFHKECKSCQRERNRIENEKENQEKENQENERKE